MKKLYYLIVIVLISGLVLTGCSLLSNVGQVPSTGQSSITYLTKSGSPPNLVGLWHFDGDALDSSGNGNNGTLHNFMSPHGWVSGIFGQALSFDGINDYVDCGSNVGSFDLLDPFTIEAWINPALNNKNNVIYGNAWAEPGYHVRVTLENKVRFILIQTGSIYKGIDSSVLTDGWHHIAAVWNGTSVKIYVDGEDDSQIAIENGIVTTIMTTANTKIGLDTTPAAHYFNGIIDEVRIWDGALTNTEIEYNSLLRYVEIDIKPGSDPNSINLGSKGVVPVAILGSVDFDAATVKPSTVTLAGAAAKLKGNSGNSGSLEDVNGDGYLDLVVQVVTTSLVLESEEMEAVLNADTHEGGHITGSDSIQIVPPK
jgi:predicted small secreted protein